MLHDGLKNKKEKRKKKKSNASLVCLLGWDRYIQSFVAALFATLQVNGVIGPQKLIEGRVISKRNPSWLKLALNSKKLKKMTVQITKIFLVFF